MAVCLLLKNKINRCIHQLCLFNIAFFVWIFFIMSIVSLIVTYICIVVYLDEEDVRNRDKELDVDFPFVDGMDAALLLQQENYSVDKVKQPSIVDNLISSHIINSSSIELLGWWMPQVRWNPEIDCSIPNQPGICRKVLSVKCKEDSIRATYQFLPINTIKPIRGIYFHAKSASFKLTVAQQITDDAIYSAIALLKYTDGSSDRIRLDFSAGTHTYLSAEVDKMIPETKVLQSVTVMLCCYGYQGSVKFMDIIVRPMTENRPQIPQMDNNYIQRCPERFRPENVDIGFDVEQFLTVEGKADDVNTPVTLVTQVSLDRINLLELTLRHWQGPVSVALYVPTKASSSEDRNRWKSVYIRKKLKDSHLRGRCDLVVVFAKTAEDDYPVNYLRNLAIRQARTQYIFNLDADFVSSPNLQSSFKSSLNLLGQYPQVDTTAFVVPAFEYAYEFIKEFPTNLPRTKQELKDQIFDQNAIISPFMSSTAPESHRLTDYRTWYTTTQPYKISSYQDKYEPYLILKNTNLPLFDERFSGYGMNKVSYTMELFASGYNFVVLPASWAIHVPHRESSIKKEFLSDPFYRLHNRATRFEFVADTMRKYRLGDCMRDA